MLHTSSRLVFRRATRTDFGAIVRLLQTSWSVFSRLRMQDIEARLDRYPAFVVSDGRALRGFLMVEPQLPRSGLIVVAALHDDSRVTAFLEAALPPLEAELRRQGIRRLVQIGQASWLTAQLPRYGFQVVDRIVTLEWERQPLPVLLSHPALRIRSAHLDDLPDLLVLDRLAFGELWQKPRATFREALGRAVLFSVGMVGDALVAYAWCDGYGDHAHLTRLATHPDHQGQGIGAHMLRHILQNLVARGVQTVTLNTQTTNRSSLELYRRFGFRPTPAVTEVFQKVLGG